MGEARRGSRPPQELLARAAIFRALAGAFAYPEAGGARDLTAQFRKLASAATPQHQPLAQALRRLSRAWAGVAEDRLRAEYARLFLGSGPVVLHETAYGDARRIAGQTTELADISGFYTAFGLRPSTTDPDLPDHLCAELEFCSVLLIKAAYANRCGWSLKGEIARRALRTFLEQHLARWSGTLAGELGHHAGTAPYRELAHALTALIRAECRCLGARPQPVAGRLPADAMHADALVCPRAAETGEFVPA